MKTLIVCKGGSVFYTRDLVIERGEQGETEGVIRRLIDRGDCNVVFYGQYRGEVIPGLTVVQSTIEGLDNWSLESEQREAYAKDHEELSKHDPIAMINVTGQAPTSSLGWNPMGAACLAFAIRYNAPMLQALHELQLPRIVLSNDPRSYPRDQEMTWYSDYCRPAAMLDQCEASFNKVVGGQEYAVHSKFANCQSWAYQYERENTNQYPAVIVAHAHFNTGIKMGKPERWYELLDNLPEGTEIFGEGWDSYDGPQENLPWCGKLKPAEVFKQFQMHVCGPVVPHTKGFLTGKPYIMISQGCIPLFHPEYDEGCELLPKDHWCRMKTPAEFKEKAEILWKDVEFREQMRESVKLHLVPKWEIFDDMIDKLLVDPDKFQKDMYWDEFGGYKRK